MEKSTKMDDLGPLGVPLKFTKLSYFAWPFHRFACAAVALSLGLGCAHPADPQRAANAGMGRRMGILTWEHQSSVAMICHDGTCQLC